jgi:hypothetical protein
MRSQITDGAACLSSWSNAGLCKSLQGLKQRARSASKTRAPRAKNIGKKKRTTEAVTVS